MPLQHQRSAVTRPLSVPELIDEASNFVFHSARPLQQWLRAAKILLTETAVCEQDGNIQMAFVYAYRHAELILSKIPEHPDYRKPVYKEGISQAKKAVEKNFEKLESWKPRINQEHRLFEEATDRRRAELLGSNEEGKASDEAESEDRSVKMGALDAGEHSRLAVDLAQTRIRKRDASKRKTRRAGIDESPLTTRRQGKVIDGFENREEDLRSVGKLLEGHDYSLQGRGIRDIMPPREQTSAYSYPAVPSQEGVMDWQVSPLPLALPSTHQDAIPPPVPTKELVHLRKNDLATAPERPPKLQSISPLDTLSHSKKYTFTSHANTEGGAPLRTLLLPPSLRQTFLALASSNTSRNHETCGVLAATPHAGALFVTHLIIPDQTSTSDTCDTTEAGDNALFDFCDKHDLVVCGWIHTHPSQTCFLSSRDLHTSSGYQIMLPEAVAIVCAPRHEPSWGIFRLTDPPGLPHVLECTRPGTFHPHELDNLYTDASGKSTRITRGHVVEGPGLDFEIVDLR